MICCSSFLHHLWSTSLWALIMDLHHKPPNPTPHPGNLWVEMITKILRGICNKLVNGTSACLLHQLQSVQSELDYKGLTSCHWKTLQMKMANNQMKRNLFTFNKEFELYTKGNNWRVWSRWNVTWSYLTFQNYTMNTGWKDLEKIKNWQNKTK